jgi:hexosaminidase
MPGSPTMNPDARPAVAIIPAPVSITIAAGWWRLAGGTTITCDPEARDCADLLGEYLAVTGLEIAVVATPIAVVATPIAVVATPREGAVALRLTGPDPGLGREGYRLDVDERGVRIRSESPAGLRHGIQTLRQLLPAEVYSTAPAARIDWRVPFVRITDRPRFSWRGSLLDVGRWHLPMEYLHRYVELLAVHKMNRFHLHLTDDQGWRFEVGRYPDLTRVGAWRAESPLGHLRDGRGDHRPHGGYYSQQELRALVAYAARRGVDVVPEIDLPGHVTAAIAAYPYLGNSTQPVAVSTTWGVHQHVLNLEASTMQFCREVLDEVMDVFPSRWVHLGGDECVTTEWSASPSAGQRLRELGLPAVSDLQEWFLNQLCAHVRARGRTPVVWDEAFTGGLDPVAVVMAWRNEAAGHAAAAAGRAVVMAPQQTHLLRSLPGRPSGRADRDRWPHPASGRRRLRSGARVDGRSGAPPGARRTRAAVDRVSADPRACRRHGLPAAGRAGRPRMVADLDVLPRVPNPARRPRSATRAGGGADAAGPLMAPPAPLAGRHVRG